MNQIKIETINFENNNWKQCSKCREVKQKSKFSKHKKTPDGLYNWCKSCVSLFRKDKGVVHNKKHKNRFSFDYEYRAGFILEKARQRSLKYRIDFNLDKEWVINKLQSGKCEISGFPFDFESKTRGPYTPSIDRIKPEDGYTKENCRLIIWALNAAFGTWGEEETRKIFKNYLQGYDNA